MKVGYARVSTEGQNLDRQIDILVAAGVDPRNIYQDKVSGKKKRNELEKMISELQSGDVVVISDLTRVSRSTKDLLNIVSQISDKGAAIKSLKDTWLDTTTDNPYNAFLLTVMSALSQLEAELISCRVKEGIEASRKRGGKCGRPSKQEQFRDAIKAMTEQGYNNSDIAKTLGISRSTVVRSLKGV